MQRILLTYQWLGDFNYAKAKIFDGFESLIIYENYGKCNTFELDVPLALKTTLSSNQKMSLNLMVFTITLMMFQVQVIS